MQIDILGDQPLFRQGVANMLLTISPLFQVVQGKTSIQSEKCIAPRTLICCEHKVEQAQLHSALQCYPNYDQIVLFTAHLGKAQRRLLAHSVDLILPLSITVEDAAYFIQILLQEGDSGVGVKALHDDKICSQFLPDLNDLTPAERSVMSRLSQGLSNADIAESLTLQVNTVKYQLASARQKLRARNRTEAATLFSSMLLTH